MKQKGASELVQTQAPKPYIPGAHLGLLLELAGLVLKLRIYGFAPCSFDLILSRHARTHGGLYYMNGSTSKESFVVVVVVVQNGGVVLGA